MSTILDMSSSGDTPTFVPRPWPARDPGESPLRGRRALVVDEDLEHARAVAGRLTRLGCINRAVRPGDLAEVLAQESWPLLVVESTCVDEALLPEDAVLVCFTPRSGSIPPAFAMRAAAFLPFDADEDALRLALGRALERQNLDQENLRLRRALEGRATFGSVVTRDPQMKKVLSTLEAVAETRANVLLLGESGTGKTRLAHALHLGSDRTGAPFVVVNCGALPDSLLESELFGHVKGAFSGAMRDRMGRFEQADTGTIFLDEINSASLDMQVKLLRVLQERTFERVGDGASVEVDVRVIAAANTDLLVEIEAGRFREDLYWRLHVVAVELPPLRERPGDIALLAHTFLERYAMEYRRPVRSINPRALSALVHHDWPGNVRQLENALERSVLLCTGSELGVEDLGAELGASHGPSGALGPATGTLLLGLENLTSLPPLKEALEGPERQLLVRALELTGGNRTDAAGMLGINRTTLFNKMRKYGLMELTFEAGGPIR